MRLTYHKVLTKNDFILYALCEYCCLLPSEAYSLRNETKSIRNGRLVKVWVDFLLTHPNDTNACWKELRSLIIRVNKITKNSKDCFEDRKQGRELFVAQVKRLPWKLKTDILLSETKTLLHSKKS